MRVRKYFKKLNIKPGPTPLPVVGSILSMLKKGMIQFDMDLVKNYGKVVVVVEGTTPTIFCADPKMLKSVLIKDFSSFRNRRV